jgi:hypothetical protein
MLTIKRLGAAALCAVSALTFSVWGADDKPKSEEIFPDTTLGALLIPDLAAARAAAGKTRLADMYAQPEMQAFLAPAIAEIKKSYAELRNKNALLPAPEDIDNGLFASDIALCFFARNGDAQMPVGGILTLAPKDPEAFKRLLPPPLRMMLVEGMVMPLGGNEGGALAYVNGRIILCVPQSDANAIVARMKDPAARAKDSLQSTAGFKAVREKMPQSMALLYVAPQKVLDAALSQPEAMRNANPALLKSLLKSTGLANINGYGTGVGFSNTDPICESFLSFAAPPKDDLFALFTSQTPVTAEGLKIASPDAPFVAGGSVNLSGIIPFIQSVTASDPEQARELDKLLAMSRQVLGFDLQKDLLENLGSEIVTTQTAIDTSVPLSFMPGMVLSIPAKDPVKVEDCIKKIADAVNVAIDKATKQTQESRELVNLVVGRFVRLEHHGKGIYYLTGQALGSKIAFSVVGNRLLVCTSYNAAKRGIEQLESKTDILSSVPFQETLARLTGKPFDAKALPSSFGYSIDTGSGSGTLLLTALGLTAETAAVAGLAEIPAVPGAGAGGPAGAPANTAANEAATILACRNFAEAEEIYHRTDYTGNGTLKYAPTLKGDNSLLEQKAGAEDLALIEKGMADAEGDPGEKTARHGYRFKVLKSQGPHAAGGQRDYVVNGNMTLGYALVAYPAEYGATGKQTFIINNSGVVFAKDLGAETAAAVKKMTQFDPDNSWIEAAGDDGLAAPPEARHGNEFEQFIARPSGKAVLSIVNTIDLGLWPDEGFFMKYRRPTGATALSSGTGIYWRSELPPPGPSTSMGINPMMMVSGVAIVSAVAIPSLLRSRMAANETAAAAGCKAYAEAQEIYHRTDYTRNGVLKYAQSIHELLETKPGAGDLALVDRTFAGAEQPSDKAVPKAGYYFKVLKAQGPHATGGKKSYVVGGNMTLGYALIAYPAAYDSTGRDSFIISNNGTIFQQDLGPDTAKIVEQMTEFDPDEKWIPTQ